MRLLIKNIGTIVGIDTERRERIAGAAMDQLGRIDNAYLVAEEGRIAAFGRMEELPPIEADEVLDAEGGTLFPSFCDSHTHLVYAGSREQEFWIRFTA